MSTDPTPDLAVLGRLEEIERDHATRPDDVWCSGCESRAPCDALQLARALRVQQQAIGSALIDIRNAEAAVRDDWGTTDLAPDWLLERLAQARKTLAAAAPSREGE